LIRGHFLIVSNNANKRHGHRPALKQMRGFGGIKRKDTIMTKEQKQELKTMLMVLQLLGQENAHIRQSFDKFPTLAERQDLSRNQGWNKWIESLSKAM